MRHVRVSMPGVVLPLWRGRNGRLRRERQQERDGSIVDGAFETGLRSHPGLPLRLECVYALAGLDLSAQPPPSPPRLP